jgi:hypothetical protein
LEEIEKCHLLQRTKKILAKKPRSPKKIQELDLVGRFNTLMKKAKEDHMKGLLDLDLGVLQDPFPNSEDRPLDSGHVEDIANEMGHSNSYAIVAILLVAVVASGTKIDQFNDLWETYENDLPILQEKVNLRENKCSSYTLILLLMPSGYTQGGTHMRVASTII